MSHGKLDEDLFTKSISCLPLVSIDLLVQNDNGEILLGFRKNPPARESWFVPGGRVRRMESFHDAFHRITNSELGFGYALQDARFAGAFEHMYDDSAYSEVVGSHYVSLAMYLDGASLEISDMPKVQHTQYCWLSLDEIERDESIHQRTKEFFQTEMGIRPR